MSKPRRFWSSDEDVLCPVGGHAVIGQRKGDEAVILFCEECNFDFYYRAGEAQPTAKKHEKEKKGCGCGSCRLSK